MALGPAIMNEDCAAAASTASADTSLYDEAIGRDTALRQWQMCWRSEQRRTIMSTPRQAVIAASDIRASQLLFLASAMLAWVIRCRERAVQRRQLAQLDDRLLRDIGLYRTDLAAECRKWFWLD
jgi:uncharacterized protein YjiS (DUF1127 family)